jgi:hypothetical protein
VKQGADCVNVVEFFRPGTELEAHILFSHAHAIYVISRHCPLLEHVLKHIKCGGYGSQSRLVVTWQGHEQTWDAAESTWRTIFELFLKEYRIARLTGAFSGC